MGWNRNRFSLSCSHVLAIFFSAHTPRHAVESTALDTSQMMRTIEVTATTAERGMLRCHG